MNIRRWYHWCGGVKDEVFSRSTSDDVVVGVDLIPLVLMLTLICVYYSGTMLCLMDRAYDDLIGLAAIF